MEEDSLLSAMEKAGSEETVGDAERKGLGTPATRADIIEKLVKDGFVKREKKQMIPTDDGMKLITVLPDVVKSPKLTADWENALTLVAKGEYSAEQFMTGIRNMVKDLVKTYNQVGEENRNMFGSSDALGKCPKCGGGEGGKMTAPITNALMEQYGVTTQELHDIAIHNLAESQIEFKTMSDVLIDMMFPEGISENDPRAFMIPPEEENPSMYVLSNAEKLNGAAALA